MHWIAILFTAFEVGSPTTVIQHRSKEENAWRDRFQRKKTGTVLCSAVTTATTDITECGDLQCSNNAKCRDNGNGGQECQCHAGYTGTTCHDDFDECGIGNPCWHRGLCHNTIGSYRCSCFEGWLDEHCVSKDNSTDVHKCETGYMGDWCQDQCLNDSMCGLTEVCKKRGRGLRCICAPGWSGVNCTADIDECMNTPCPDTASCVNTLGSYHCQCLPGWKGDSCDEDVDECLVSPCSNSGTCTNNDGSYNCTCSQGWHGFNCLDDIDECQMSLCSNKGTCTNSDGSYTCLCTQGWQGETCQYPDSCYFFPCRNSATCVNLRNTYQCTCAVGWNGDNCTEDMDECTLYSPCKNNGTCTNTIGSFACNCSSRWQGDLCNIDVNECFTEPCNSSFLCQNTEGSFSCEPSNKGSEGNARTSIDVIVGSVLGSVVIFGGLITGVILAKQKFLNKNSISNTNESGQKTTGETGNVIESQTDKADVGIDSTGKSMQDYL